MTRWAWHLGPARRLDATEGGVARSRLLPADVEIMLAAGDRAAARAAADELCAIAADTETPWLSALAAHVTGLSARLGLPQRLSEVGVPEAGIPELVEGAMGDGCTLMNPRDPSEEDFAELYRAAL